MGLRINTNVPALNSARTLARSTAALRHSLEPLSNRLRINRAADDSAGLAIAEASCSQVRGAQTAQRDSQDGINSVQTAECAVTETTSTLQRIRERSLQSGPHISQTLRVALACARSPSMWSTLGDYPNRFVFTVSTLSIQEENAAAAKSGRRGVDIVREAILRARNQLLVNAGLKVLAQANVASQCALPMLGT